MQEMQGQLVDLQPLYSSEEETDDAQEELCCYVPVHTRGFFEDCFQKISKPLFNIKFSLQCNSFLGLGQGQRKPLKMEESDGPVYFLGNCYNFTKVKEFLEHYRSTIWMSYRQKLGKSDAGWGCTIRVVQMAIAEAFRRNNPEAEHSRIINLFRDGARHPFSLQKICSYGNIRARWTGCNEILSIVASMIENESKKSSQPHDLRLNIHTTVFYQSVKLERQSKQPQFPKLLIVSNKVSQIDDKMPAHLTAHLKRIMQMRSFCGMIGGLPGEALFLGGFLNQRAIILDPHYVQDDDSNDTFFLNVPMGVSMSRLCSSFSICFFIKDAEEYEAWGQEIEETDEIFYPNLVFGMTKRQQSERRERRESDQFEIL